jgi:hypothetical protein
MVNDWENEGGAIRAHDDVISSGNCNHLMFSYGRTVIYCCKRAGHKGYCEMSPLDKDRRNAATMEFMRKVVSKPIRGPINEK